MSPLVSLKYRKRIGNNQMKFYGNRDRIHGFSHLEMVRKWYQTALAQPDAKNPLMGDDLNGVKNKKFWVPLKGPYRLLICGGSWEKPALSKGNENRVFFRKAYINTDTVVLVSIINVILPAGGHLAKQHIDTKANRKKAVVELEQAMRLQDVSARFKIFGPYPSKKPVGLVIEKDDLLRITTPLSKPFMDIDPNPGLETDPPEWRTLPMRKGSPAYSDGYYACFELNTPGKYIIDIDGSAPLAGHQSKHAHLVSHNMAKKSLYHLNELIFHNSSKYELYVRKSKQARKNG
jgi:hypothetical protein